MRGPSGGVRLSRACAHMHAHKQTHMHTEHTPARNRANAHKVHTGMTLVTCMRACPRTCLVTPVMACSSSSSSKHANTARRACSLVCDVPAHLCAMYPAHLLICVQCTLHTCSFVCNVPSTPAHLGAMYPAHMLIWVQCTWT